jgi:uncharacterized SAM-binding protein YcdF (DUF218 family)
MITAAAPLGRTRRRWWVLAAWAGLLLVGWGAGLAWFSHRIDAASPPPPDTDGIIALTGGAGRVDAALHLLARNPGARLLISGIGPHTAFDDLVQRAGLSPEPLRPRVSLGRSAASTRGNAIEAEAWARAHQVLALTVVTASFHMPRALVELRARLPGVALHPLPVGMESGRRRVSARVLLGEYHKYLVAVAGLSGLFTPREVGKGGPDPA